MSDETQWTGSLDLYHPRGPRVKLPILPGYDYAAAFAAVSAALDAGFLAQAPGLDEGEEKESIGWVLRGAFEKDGQTTPFVLLYASNEALTWSVLKVYLNRQEDIEAFEYASGMKLDKLPDYIGDNKPQRGAATKTDAFIVKSPRPFGVVYRRNPKHDDTEAGKMKPARLFVRWEKTKPEQANPEPNRHPLDEAKVTSAEQWLEGDPGLVLFNEKWVMVQGDTPTQKAIRSRMVAHGARAGLTLVGKEWHKPDAQANELDEAAIPF